MSLGIPTSTSLLTEKTRAGGQPNRTGKAAATWIHRPEAWAVGRDEMPLNHDVPGILSGSLADRLFKSTAPLCVRLG